MAAAALSSSIASMAGSLNARTDSFRIIENMSRGSVLLPRRCCCRLLPPPPALPSVPSSSASVVATRGLFLPYPPFSLPALTARVPVVCGRLKRVAVLINGVIGQMLRHVIHVLRGGLAVRHGGQTYQTLEHYTCALYMCIIHVYMTI